jgi:hypothetical protein
VENAQSQSRELYTSYLRLNSTSNNQRVIAEARQDLETSLDLLQVDIDDMEDSVKAVEESGSRWGLSYEEVQRRRRTLENVKADVKVCLKSHRCFSCRLKSLSFTLQKMRSTISNGQTSAGSQSPFGQSPNPADSQTDRKQRGGDPFTDVELGQTAGAPIRKGNDNSAYSDDPYAERRSDEIEEYEMEQQQVGFLV